MKKARVISVVPYQILPARLGGEKGIAVFNEYVGALADLTAISTRNNDTSQAKNYLMLGALSNSRWRYINFFLFFKIRKLLKQKRATHLLIEHPYYGWLAWLIKRTTNITWVVHSHNIEFERSRSIGRRWWPLLKYYERWVYKQSDINFFISEDDRQFAIQHLSIPAEKSFAITYGVEIDRIPSDRSECRALICRTHQIDTEEKILLFNGALYHHTNYEALRIILNVVNPFLLKQIGLRYKIVVCGKGLPDSFGELRAFKDLNIIYAGFVNDISIYFKATDLFLNPILSGGGVKTKAIEAIAYNCSVVSTTIGALGLNRAACGEKLEVVENENWEDFCIRSIAQLKKTAHTDSAFYDYYYWGNIARKVVEELNRTTPALHK